ncbi:MAG: undecaprenyl-phosphate glucose phosphotransferase [Methylotenera sp.]|uniref:undecaprenyl-phosphate glucose phosphotransferase n=1 Tax=Methylotenera sp. TaxID=2051956 RepID=UPI00271EF4C4|nr:undecaprenyl-phosphate glucose phosphotransferase [Methylotenera sp.]MDO9150267.1 undecaprenyl-phosphate glucose phosphotransferase [Methylotenera sp.]
MRFQQQLSFSKALNFHTLIKILVDPVLMIASLFILTNYFQDKITSQYVVLSIMIFALTFPGVWVKAKSFFEELFNTFVQWFLTIGILLLFGYATGYLNHFAQQIIVLWAVITPVILVLAHLLVASYLSSKYYIASVKKTAVIIGVNELSQQLFDRVNASRELAIEVKGFFDVISEQSSSDFKVNDIELMGTVADLPEYVKNHKIDLIYIALPPSLHDEIMTVLDDLKDTTASIYFVPNFFMADLIQARIDDIDGMPVVAVCETPFSGFNGFMKSISDFILATTILCLISPLLIVLGLGVKLSSPGPILFKQRRYGLDGHEIVVYKFRSMTVTEDGDKVTQATVNDKRVTKFGKFIRKTSLDELPQFINVIQGRMSIVGPRPHAVSHNEMYRKVIKGYMVRHKVKPGITGWAQVNGFRGETESVESMKSRIEYDLDYLKKWSLSLDLKIILKTVLLVFRDSKAY